MARRKRKPLCPSVTLPWTPAFAELFAPGPMLLADAQPPARVRIWRGQRTITAVAVFRSAATGQTSRCTYRGPWNWSA